MQRHYQKLISIRLWFFVMCWWHYPQAGRITRLYVKISSVTVKSYQSFLFTFYNKALRCYILLSPFNTNILYTSYARKTDTHKTYIVHITASRQVNQIFTIATAPRRYLRQKHKFYHCNSVIKLWMPLKGIIWYGLIYTAHK